MKRYELVWRNKWLTADAKTIQEMADMLEIASRGLAQMAEAGIELENPEPSDDYAWLVTNDKKIADEYQMQDRKEIYEDDGETFEEED